MNATRATRLCVTFAAVSACFIDMPLARADSNDAVGDTLYASCVAAASILDGHPLLSEEQDLQFEQPLMCIQAVTALMDLEPFLKPELAMCPPEGTKISYAQMTWVVAAYLRNHPEQLHDNIHVLAARSLHQAWPCPAGGADSQKR
jgi:hypothetical protein